MALARLTTWIDGNVLTAAALNGEFDNIVNNALSLISPLSGPINFNNNQAQGFVVETYGAAPTSTFTEGRIFYYPQNQYMVMWVGTTIGAGADSIVGPSYGLGRPTNLQGSLISNIGSFSAQGYQLQRHDPGSAAIPLHHMAATSSFSVNTQTAGPIVNGRDQAAAFTSTTVHFYAISTGHRSTSVQGVVSSVAPPAGPTLPSSYACWAYLGSAIYTPASSVMTKSALISGNQVTLSTYEQVLTSGGSTAVSTGIPLGGIVPQIAPLIMMTMVNAGGIPTGSGGLNAEHKVYVSSSGATGSNSFEAFTVYTESSMTWRGTTMGFRIPNINTPPSVAYRNAINTGTSATLSLLVNGYTVPNGDVG